MKSDPYMAQFLQTMQVGELEGLYGSDFITPSWQSRISEEVEERFNLLASVV